MANPTTHGVGFELLPTRPAEPESACRCDGPDHDPGCDWAHILTVAAVHAAV